MPAHFRYFLCHGRRAMFGPGKHGLRGQTSLVPSAGFPQRVRGAFSHGGQGRAFGRFLALVRARARTP
eukprot:7284380-Lingulodinium_polyedra.AAC.1